MTDDRDISNCAVDRPRPKPEDGWCCIGCSTEFPPDVDRQAHLATCDGPRAYWNGRGGEEDGSRTCPGDRPPAAPHTSRP